MAFRIIFEKDEWINGKAIIQILTKDIEDEGDISYTLKKTHRHSIYDNKEDISKKDILYKLMKEGVFTNSWFAVLDASRKYDTQILIENNAHILEDNNCEYMENRMKNTHTGSNGFDIKKKQNKP